MLNAILRKCSAAPSRQALSLRWCSSTKIDFKKMIDNNKVVVFMKGVPEKPRCGFSNAVVQILRAHGINYDAHNVLDDWDMRQGLKEYTKWPTIPQVFVDGEFIGGADILYEMHRTGALLDVFEKAGIKSKIERIEENTDKKDAKNTSGE
ncbi:UNVERIFIED_CONTAM: hypothetical protein PYX00_009213 [Menopon gallinae]|uniref:Glutaredoxin-related protein 5, mitochondrial n=1 Tax=Menopon gallinae TaxID=328185 RepID=A0AAW2HAE6_9NEOP